jgi:hypothetical protein
VRGNKTVNSIGTGIEIGQIVFMTQGRTVIIMGTFIINTGASVPPILLGVKKQLVACNHNLLRITKKIRSRNCVSDIVSDFDRSLLTVPVLYRLGLFSVRVLRDF